MFRDDYEGNLEYFNNLAREDYLSAMLKFIETSLFSSNIFNIYTEPENLEEKTKGKLSYIRAFYDDFLLDEFRVDPDAILKTKFFEGMVFAMTHDSYARNSSEFTDLFDYVFKESLDYDDIVEVLIKEPTRKLDDDETLSMREFDTLCNYVKNNTEGYVPMSIVTKMLKNHAYKTNHIFDAEVVESLIRSTAKSYLERFGIDATVEFTDDIEVEDKNSYSIDPAKITLDENLIEEFLSLNYTEIFTVLFAELDLLKDEILISRDEVNYATLKTLMQMLVDKVDFEKIYIDATYRPSEYLLDVQASSFVSTLRFFSSFGVNLFQNYINSGIDAIEADLPKGNLEEYSNKEISLDQRFFQTWNKLDNKKSLTKKFNVLNLLFDATDNRLRTIDLIKKMAKTEHREFLEEYLHSRIVAPEIMIEDVIDLSGYKPKDEYTKELIERELKYIYVDTFYYSLDSYLKLKSNSRFDKEEYLMDISVKINCIKDTPLTHRFIDEALFTLEEAKQNA